MASRANICNPQAGTQLASRGSRPCKFVTRQFVAWLLCFACQESQSAKPVERVLDIFRMIELKSAKATR